MTDDATLHAWAMTVGSLALKAMAHDMPYVRETKKPEVVAWLMEHRRDVLEDSRRLSGDENPRRVR